jgi:hypothetical protein
MPKTIVHAFMLVASIVGVLFAASKSRPYAPMLIGPMAGAIVALKLYWLDDEQNHAEQVALMASIARKGGQHVVLSLPFRNPIPDTRTLSDSVRRLLRGTPVRGEGVKDKERLTDDVLLRDQAPAT